MLKLVKFVEEDGGQKAIVCLALTDRNFEKLKKGQPIIFPSSDLRLYPDRQIVIAYEGDEKTQREILRLNPAVVFAIFLLDDECFEQMRRGSLVKDVGEFRCQFHFFWIESEEKGMKALQEFIGPKTVVQRKGFPPSEISPPTN